jgi:hypothetical protein
MSDQVPDSTQEQALSKESDEAIKSQARSGLTFQEKATLATTIMAFLALLGNIFIFVTYRAEKNAYDLENAAQSQLLNELVINERTSLFSAVETQPALTVEILSRQTDADGKLDYLVSWDVYFENRGQQLISVNSHEIKMHKGSIDASKSKDTFEINNPNYEGSVLWNEIHLKNYQISEENQGRLEAIATGEIGPGDNFYSGASMIIRALPGELVHAESWIEFNEVGQSADEDGYMYEFDFQILPGLEDDNS